MPRQRMVLLVVLANLWAMVCATSPYTAMAAEYADSAFGIFGAYAQEYDWFKQQMGFDDDAYWNWVDGHFVRLGAHWTRSNLQLIWDVIEPMLGGGYVWDNAMHTDGVVTHIYDSPAGVNWLGVFHPGGGTSRNPLAYPTAYTTFVRAVVERYDGDGVDDVAPGVAVKYWQAGNEIEDWINTGRTLADYVQFVRLVRGAALAADPEAKIVLIAQTTGGLVQPFLQNVVQQLGPDREFDVIDLHHWNPAGGWRMTALGTWRSVLNAAGATHARIWSCEHGTWVGTPTGQLTQTEEDQARSLIKRYVWNRANGLDKLFWNNLIDWYAFAGSSTIMFNSMGLVSDGQFSDDSPERLNTERVAYWAYQRLAANTDNGIASLAGSVTGVHNETDLFAYKYVKAADGADVYIIWSESGNPSVSFNVPGKLYRVINMITDRFGNILEQYDLRPTNSQLNLTIQQDPLFIQNGCTQAIPGDFDSDCDVDKDDLAQFVACITGPALPGPPAGCPQIHFIMADADHDEDVDQEDFGVFQRCLSGPDIIGNPNCAQ